MKFTVILKEADKSLTHSSSTEEGVVINIQESLAHLAIEYVHKYRPNAVFSVAEINFLKEFESDLFRELANSQRDTVKLYRYITDREGKQYTLNYEINRL